MSTEEVKALVEELRYGAEYGCDADLIERAADAIEELSAQLADKDKLIELQFDEIQRLRADVKRQQKKMIELAKQLPKRGEWKTTDAFPHRVYCSNCFRTYVPNDRWQIWVDKPGEGGLERNYCPSCGAKMEVQDADTDKKDC